VNATILTAGARFIRHIPTIVVEVAVPRRVNASTVGTSELVGTAHRRI